jgi:hypothetical protein
MNGFLTNEPFAYWLDGASSHTSILGAASGGGDSSNGSGGGQRRRVEYWGKESSSSSKRQGVYVYEGDKCTVLEQDILSYLQEQQRDASLQVKEVLHLDRDVVQMSECSPDELPFDFLVDTSVISVTKSGTTRHGSSKSRNMADRIPSPYQRLILRMYRPQPFSGLTGVLCTTTRQATGFLWLLSRMIRVQTT